MKPRMHTLTIKDKRQETKDAVSLAFEIPEELLDRYNYIPGQHLSLEAEINGEKVRRSYSVCTGKHENELRVAVKRMPFGKFSTFANEELTIGDEIRVMTPIGDFTADFDENTEKSFLFFAAGSGITPIMSLIKSILFTSPKCNVTLVYGNRGFEHVIFREELEDLKNKYMNTFSLVHVFSEEKIGNQMQDGLLGYDQVKKIYELKLAAEGADEIYVCGPEPVIFAVRDVFTEAGYKKDNIHFELFTSPDDDKKALNGGKKKEIAPEDQITSKVTVILDGEQVTFDLERSGDVILDAAIEHRMDAPYSCKGGVCSTCKGKVIKGEVEMDKNYALEDDEVEAGYILTCQSHPTTAEVIISYDE